MAIGDWLTLSQTSGSSGTTVITMTAATNEELERRLETLYIGNPTLGVFKEAEISQKTWEPYIEVEEPIFEINSSAQVLTLHINSNIEWKII